MYVHVRVTSFSLSKLRNWRCKIVSYDKYIPPVGCNDCLFPVHRGVSLLGTQCIRPHSGVHAVGSGICLIVPALILQEC